jgi:hypothetical protein
VRRYCGGVPDRAREPDTSLSGNDVARAQKPLGRSDDESSTHPGGLPRHRRSCRVAGVNVSGGVNAKKYLIEATGNGVVIFDYDNDGLMDVFLVSGTMLDGKGPGQGATSHLYRNLGNSSDLGSAGPRIKNFIPLQRIPEQGQPTTC